MTKKSNDQSNGIPQMLSVKRVAEILDTCERHVRREIKDGNLPAHRFRGSIRVSVEDLKAYIAASR